jgi:hypothetical protein
MIKRMNTEQNTITLYRCPSGKCWVAVFGGPQLKEFIDAFGTNTFPLPWCDTAKAEDVLRSQVRANPYCHVVVSSVEV